MSNELKVTELDQAMAEIERQAAEIERLQHWQRAVDDACTVSWVAVTDDARETVKALIARERQIAIDPLVSSDAQALIDRGRKDAEAEIERLKARLEVSPDHPYDGIASRDATIKRQDEYIAKLREQDPISSAALRAAEQAAAEGRTESVIAIYRAIREAQIDLPPSSSAPSNGAGAGLGERGKSASSVCIQQNDVELHLART